MNSLAVAPETMTSTQLAKLLGKKKKHINEKIKLMFSDKIDGQIIRPSFDARGYVVDYLLPEIESKMFVSQFDLNYLEEIVKFWIDKGNTKLSLPKNFPEALRLVLSQIIPKSQASYSTGKTMQLKP